MVFQNLIRHLEPKESTFIFLGVPVKKNQLSLVNLLQSRFPLQRQLKNVKQKQLKNVHNIGLVKMTDGPKNQAIHAKKMSIEMIQTVVLSCLKLFVTTKKSPLMLKRRKENVKW